MHHVDVLMTQSGQTIAAVDGDTDGTDSGWSVGLYDESGELDDEVQLIAGSTTTVPQTDRL